MLDEIQYPCHAPPAGSGDSGPPPAPPRLSLGGWLQRAGSAIRAQLPELAWVEVEVGKVRIAKKGAHFDLADASVNASARGGALCAFADAGMVARLQEQFGKGFDLHSLEGRSGHLLLGPSFHPKRHLGGVVHGIDPQWQIGLQAQMVDRLRNILQAEGLYDAQRQLATPRDVFRLAVIHPENSASLADVSNKLGEWQKAGILEVAYFSAIFEGPRAPESIAAAIGQLGHAGEGTPSVPDYDLALMVRGGGNAVALGMLDDHRIVESICRCTVPIITGLGHAGDCSLADEVAWRRADTPSRALGVVADILRKASASAEQDRTRIDRLAWQWTFRKTEALAKDAAFASAKVRQCLHIHQIALECLLTRCATAAEMLSRRADAAPGEPVPPAFQPALAEAAPCDGVVPTPGSSADAAGACNGASIADANGASIASAQQARREPLIMLKFHDGIVAVQPLSGDAMPTQEEI